MSVIAHDGKVVVANGKALNFGNLIELANNTTGETDTTLTDAIQRLVDGYGGGGQAFDYDIIEYVVATDSGNTDPGTLYTIPHGLSYTPTWFVAMQVPTRDFSSLEMKQVFCWIGLLTHSAYVCRMNNATDLNFINNSKRVGIGVSPMDTANANCDSTNFYIRAAGWGERSVKSGSTIYVITKNMGV